MKSRNWLALIGVLGATALFGSPATAATCVTASVATYTTGGFSCSVGPVTFSNINVNTLSGNGGFVALGNFTPFVSNGEYGLSLNYVANAVGTNAFTDIAWTYNVAANFLSDVYLSLAGTTTGTGTTSVSEVLSNGVVISLNGPGATSTTFDPIAMLFAIKDQFNFAGSNGSSSTSILTNAFSVSAVPLPGALPLFAGGLGLMGLLMRKRRRVVTTTV